MILIITNKQDCHPTPVIECLREQGCPVFRLNTEALLTDYDFRWTVTASGTDFWIRNRQTGLETWGHEVTAVWERRPELPTVLRVANVREEINKHNREEAAGFLSFLLYYLGDRFCIGHHLHERLAGSKMWQLKVAQDLGMAVPDTCFSNRKEDIVEFARVYDYVILKSIEDDNVWLDDEEEYVFYGRRVDATTLPEVPEEAFTQTVSFVQEYVDKLFELRVTVVGRKVFACKLDSQRQKEDEGKVDWRQGYEHGLRHEAFELPEEMADFCRAYLREMRLNFGCFDFIVTLSGEYVFLECNPNGQWLWVELETGMNISAAIAECLMNGSTLKAVCQTENGTTTAHVEEAGTSPFLMGDKLKHEITNLTLIGHFKEIREEKEDVIMGKTRLELYNDWVDRVCRFIEEAGPRINCVSCAMQSKPVLDREPEVVFLGYNAHEPYGYMGPNRERFYAGNPSFYTDRDKAAWKVWRKPYDAMKFAGYTEPMTDGNFVFMNAVFFGSENIKALQAKPGSKEVVEQCLDFTAEAIQEVFRPRCVVCFSIGDCFRPLEQRFGFTEVETVTPRIINGESARQTVTKGMWGEIPVYGIPHPSGRVSNDDWGGIALWLKEEMTQG